MSITEQDLAAARIAWGDALIAISKAYDEAGIDAARTLAEQTINAAYGYDIGPVLFKPTLAGGEQTFRPTRKGALSYFVAHDADFPGDSGFALKGWREVRSHSSAHFIEGDVGLWMGNVDFINKDGVTRVDKSFGYKRDEKGNLKIVLHHSSLPYVPA